MFKPRVFKIQRLNLPKVRSPSTDTPQFMLVYIYSAASSTKIPPIKRKWKKFLFACSVLLLFKHIKKYIFNSFFDWDYTCIKKFSRKNRKNLIFMTFLFARLLNIIEFINCLFMKALIFNSIWFFFCCNCGRNLPRSLIRNKCEGVANFDRLNIMTSVTYFD